MSDKVLSGFIPSIQFDEEVQWIMGRPNFWCGQVAARLRKLGYTIKEHAEEEQAAVIFWMLLKYATHGPAWREYAQVELRGDLVDSERAEVAAASAVQASGLAESSGALHPPAPAKADV